jgi:hypothetical protein
VALKRPERRLGGSIDSSASSFTDGSTRVYTVSPRLVASSI